MARDPQIDARLQRWAERLVVGDASGYSRVCTLHESWAPPQPGMRPALKVSSATDVGQTHRCVGRLPIKLRNACVVHYVLKGSIEHQAAMLDCEPGTVFARIERAHRDILRQLSELSEVMQGR